MERAARTDSDAPAAADAAPRLDTGIPTQTAPAPRRGWASWRYYCCLGVLVVCAASMQSVQRFVQVHFQKQRLELKNPLHALRTSELAPEYELHAIQPPPLDTDVQEALGTSEYINWLLVSRDKDRRDPTHLARLFVSYYTGKPDMVPHEPRECLWASGWKLVEENLEYVEVFRGLEEPVRIPVAVLDFERVDVLGASVLDENAQRLTVLFFFLANGKYVTTRNQVRLALSNLWDRYAYYSKIEVDFISDSGAHADRAASLEAIRPLLQKLMPILWADHYPDWPPEASPQ